MSFHPHLCVIFKYRDVVRVRRAVKHLHESSRIIAKEMYFKEGIKSFYSGLGATLLVYIFLFNLLFIFIIFIYFKFLKRLLDQIGVFILLLMNF